MIQWYNCITMSNFVTTNIRIPEEDYLRLKEEAVRKRKSFSAIIREKVGGKKKISSKDYAKILLSIKSDWFNAEEVMKNRKQVEKQIKLRGWAGK